MCPFGKSNDKARQKNIEPVMFSLKYARRMKDDVISDAVREELWEKQQTLKQLLHEKKLDEAEKLAEAAGALARQVHPAPRNAYGLRENVEVFVVVLAVALGFRTYFLQPYQIPTGSMQPTLYGITADPDYEPDWTDRFPVNVGKFLLTGARYVEVRAKSNGIIPPHDTWQQRDMFYLFSFGNNTYTIHQEFARLVDPGQGVQKGELLARGLRRQGDSIVVNRMTTNFVPPRRGDIVVFSTRDIGHQQVRDNSAYIKRLVGLPGETVSLREGRLIVNGETVTEPDVFIRQYEGRGYQGYSNGMPGSGPTTLFPNGQAALTLGPNECLFFGDNTLRSLDGRIFGGVSGRNVIGTAFFVPWPFFDRGYFGETAGFVK